MFDKLVTFSIFLYYCNFLFFVYIHQYSFSSDKKWLFIERFLLFLERHVYRKNKQLLLPDFSVNNFFD